MGFIMAPIFVIIISSGLAIIWKKKTIAPRVAPNLSQLQAAQNQLNINIPNAQNEEVNIREDFNYNNTSHNKQIMAASQVILVLCFLLGAGLFLVALRISDNQTSTLVFIQELFLPFIFAVLFPLSIYVKNKDLCTYAWREIKERVHQIIDQLFFQMITLLIPTAIVIVVHDCNIVKIITSYDYNGV